MLRGRSELEHQLFDVLVVGGGIYGACVARDAALRGFKVALVERGDFGSQTSHNSLKLIHGGMRYLQHLDFRRVRQSLNERRFWLSMAPHLVQPLEFVIPTQGYVTRGPMALLAANVLHRCIGPDWNRGVAKSHRIPLGRVHTRKTLEQRVPGLPMDGITGAATFCDGQILDADRLLLECLMASYERDAVIANYVLATGFLMGASGASGIVAVDQLDGTEFEIRARVTINACGPWIGELLRNQFGEEIAACAPPLSRNMNIVTRRLFDGYGVGIPSRRPADGVLSDEFRLFFVTPWHDVSVTGTTHFPYTGHPDDFHVAEDEVVAFVDELNEAYPPANLMPSDVLYAYAGLTPADDGNRDGEVVRSRHPNVIDHEASHGIAGIYSVIGVKYTTARLVAEQVIDMVARQLGSPASGHASRTTPLPGARGWEAKRVTGANTATLSNQMAALLPRSGGREDESSAGPAKHSFDAALESCVRFAIQSEMAVRLGDILFRRTDLAPLGQLDWPLMCQTADIMAPMLGWDMSRRQEELDLALSQSREACCREIGKDP